MNKLGGSIWRGSLRKNNFVNSTTCLEQSYKGKSTKPEGSSTCSSSSSSSSSDDETKSAISKPKNEDKINKLNSLLAALVEKDIVAKPTNINLAKPTNKRIKKEPGTESVKRESVEKKMVAAVKDVANELGGNIRQTESELLMKLLNPETSPTNSKNIMSLVKDMKVEKDTTGISRAKEVKDILQQKHTRRPARSDASQRVSNRIADLNQNIDLSGSKPLGIFTDPSKLQEIPGCPMWEKLNERELKLSITHPPANYYQQLIQWTEQGKLWQFPIDNEQGLDEEKKVYFAKHVFLEEHLEPWCPPKGPVRHFMELVCVGLSKNAFLTVEAKIEHIMWYKNYFEEKKKLLQETGAIPIESSEQKSIE